jgi:hypothetical protein
MIEFRQLRGGFGNQLFQFAKLYTEARKGLIPDIYVQDEKHFADYKDEVRLMYGQGVESIDMVSLHIRRGDYVNNPFYIDLTKGSYYKEAVDQFPGERFLVFCADRQPGSDDIEDMQWCARFLSNMFPEEIGRFDFFQGRNELEDFNAMAGCKGHIIANSSFSWWAAYVSGNETVAPKLWFTDGKDRGSIVTSPDNWTRL